MSDHPFPRSQPLVMGDDRLCGRCEGVGWLTERRGRVYPATFGAMREAAAKIADPGHRARGPVAHPCPECHASGVMRHGT